MAKEGKSVSKGFGFYLMIFLIALVFAFIAIVVAMVLMPKTKILGLQYFTYNDTATIDKFNTQVKNEDGEDIYEDLSFSGIREAVINCGSSDVIILPSANDKSSIKFVQQASGFAKAKDNVEYIYSVDYQSYKKGILKIDVKEPAGFLNFSDNMAIEISVAKSDIHILSFNITTTSGNVQIGVGGVETSDILYLYDCMINTNSGNIVINDKGQVRGDLNIKTQSGNFESKYENMAPNACVLSTKTGTFKFKSIAKTRAGFVDASMGNGTLSFDKIMTDLKIGGDNFKLNGETIGGSLDSSNRTYNKATINLNRVDGDVSMPFAKESSISIHSIGGQTYIETTKGNVTIGGEVIKKNDDGKLPRERSGLSKQSLISTQSGKINVIVNDIEPTTHYFNTISGEITLEFPTAVQSQNYVTSETGKVNVNIFSYYELVFMFENRAGAFRKLSDNLEIDLVSKDEFSNPLWLNGYRGDQNLVEIVTDGKISCGLLNIKTLDK